jgi:hypothetical protein
MDIGIGMKEEELDKAMKKGATRGIEDPTMTERALGKAAERVRKKRSQGKR